MAFFTAIPDEGPLSLAGQQLGQLLEFFVQGEAEKVFIRVIALFRDNMPLGAEVLLTFQIRSGTGVFRSVGPDSGEVGIQDDDGNPVGSLRCQREPRDIFLITIMAPPDHVFSDVVDISKPWMLRIKNHDPEPLRVLGFSSHREGDTRQPWMRLGDPNTDFISSHLEISESTTRSIEVRNWGTGPLRLDDEPGPIGDRDSVLILRSLPRTVDPHQVGVITVEAAHVATESDTPNEVVHQFRCNDTIEAHAKLTLERIPSSGGGGGWHPPPESVCSRCDCVGFVGSQTTSNCERGSCRHHRNFHIGI